MKHCVPDILGTQKKGALEAKAHLVAVLLIGSGGESCGEGPGAWAPGPGCLGANPTSHHGPMQVVWPAHITWPLCVSFSSSLKWGWWQSCCSEDHELVYARYLVAAGVVWLWPWCSGQTLHTRRNPGITRFDEVEFWGQYPPCRKWTIEEFPLGLLTLSWRETG